MNQTTKKIKLEESSPQVKELATALSKFSLNLYQKLSEEKPAENLFLSPYSIAIALSMTLAGAKGNTLKQMLDVLNIGETVEKDLHQTHEEYISLLEKVQNGFVLNTANRLFVNEKFYILPDFVQLVSKMYHSVSENVNFGNGAKVAKEINDWVSQVTNGKIKDLIQDGILTEMTALMLVNAIYFKGKWDQAFDPHNTRLGNFYNLANEKVPVDMMFMKKKLLFKDDESIRGKILQLPYIGKQLTMYIILPNKVDGLKDVETKVNAKFLESLLCNDGFHSVEVEVFLPKFKVSCSFELEKVLSSLGMIDIFNEDKSDLSGMGNGQLYVSKVLHKAFVEVSEEGTEAAAATAVVVNLRCMRFTYRFKADHPFIFFIADKRSQMVLFMGKLVSPQK